MTTKSSKAKGRRLQQQLCDFLLECDPYGAYESRAMGQRGSDIVDPQGRLPWVYVECRNREQWPSLPAIVEEMQAKPGLKEIGENMWAAMYSRNRVRPVFVVSEPVMKMLLDKWLQPASIAPYR